ncbi:hypothetical protein N7468_008801 [Penicillium chermesinum]|uniref:Nucleoside phosphorylase domain-containing protein n=1 Tax=Penicillium chermesinum TaxID=63820 RepID=A0A9W9NGK6_9EURO|nr:uncharacterized protein N7468_008801 [Penicillium chermesinum]KAJ5219597.1 hypothetical protein N7468_008801 [Penicillium chermesinum]KAJ6153610.1 hypothetical protein N7470_006569 [Penicillium chermesinum]
MQSVLNETTINEYYEWAWMTANATNLGETIGPIYEKAINHCLDGNELEARQDLLYEKVVLPLQELYCAYKDDWDIQENPIQDPTAQETQQPKQVSFRLTGRPQFSIAIFCALPLEATAVNDIFDDVWNEERENSWRSAGDENTYTFGRIVCYNVVLVHMGDMGKNAASQATAGIKASYPEIKLALIVGICGGVPTYSTADKDEMILGDIVISDGIVRYDFGKQFPDTYMSRAAPEVVALPNHRVRGILAKLKGERVKERMERRISQHVQALQDELGTRGSVYVGTDRDELFHPSYPHKHQDPDVCAVCNIKGSERVCEKARTMSCDELGCEKSSLTPRKRLYEASMGGCTPKPKIHFGHVGSGDTVMKSGQHRDKTASPWKLVAFEMEASGVWDMLPCLVIKGVCDYSDSHKNKSWQEYAATTAAACVRAVLEEYVIAQ